MPVCRLGSWTYSGNDIDFQAFQYADGGFVTTWDYADYCPSVLQSLDSKRNVYTYEGVDDSYVDIVINLQIARRQSR